MAGEPSSRGGNTMLAFILGAVVVAVAVLAWFVLDGRTARDEPDFRIQLPGGGAVEGEIREGSGGNGPSAN